MNDSWEDAEKIRAAMCNQCSFKKHCQAAYNPDLPCPDAADIEENLGIDF